MAKEKNNNNNKTEAVTCRKLCPGVYPRLTPPHTHRNVVCIYL